MIDKRLKEAFHFHLNHCGYCDPPGRAVCALKLAKAELAIKDADDWRVRWVTDDDPSDKLDHDCGDPRCGEAMKEAYNEGRLVVEGCIVEHRCGECEKWHVADSLWGIDYYIRDERETRRSFAAEVALQAGILKEMEVS